MAVELTPFRSRVALRVFLLFVAVAVLPMAISAAFTSARLQGALQEEAYSDLRAESRRFGQALFGRLRASRRVLADDGAPGELAAEMFAGVWQKGKDSWAPVFPGQRLADLDPSWLPGDFDGKPRLAVRDGVAVMLAETANGHLRFGALDTGYLVGELTDLPAGTHFCIAEQRRTLACSDPVPKELQLWHAEPATGADLDFEVQGEAWLGSRWRLFTPSGFDASPWEIVIMQPARLALGMQRLFTDAFLFAIGATFVAVALLASVQIRRSLQPLERLVRGTEAFAARRFDKRIEVGPAGDEFSALADALNTMAGRLAHQFKTLDLLAKVDNQILCADGIDPVLEQSLEKLRQLVGATEVCMIMGDPDHPTTARSFAADASGTTLARRELSPSDRVWLEALAPGTELNQIDAARFFSADSGTIYAWRIDTGSEAQSVLFVYGDLLTEEQKRSISDFAARMAVALTAAERDAELYRRANLDHLTGLPNRELFNDRLTQAIAMAKATQTKVGVLFVDLDRFKDVNDSLGHGLGDEVLKVAAKRLADQAGIADTVARIGGDEFIVVIPQYGDETKLRRRVEQVLTSLAQPIQLEQQELYLTASVGVASYPQDGETMGELMRKADAAMYAAKEKGGADARRFSENMDEQARRRVSLASELRRAIEQDELWLAYQPKISLTTGMPMGAEALARWTHPTRGAVSPGEFMPVIEETGLMEPFGEWLLDRACAQASRWLTSGQFHGRLAINISARQIQRGDLIDSLDRALVLHRLDPVSLELELTESALAEDIGRANMILDGLRTMGFTVAIDDFGTGYSSLEYVRSLTFDVLKIDQTFVRDMTNDRRAEAIAGAIVSLGKTLGKLIVAEGIETSEQARALEAMGCQLGQGFYFARPMAEDDLLAWADGLQEQKASA